MALFISEQVAAVTSHDSGNPLFSVYPGENTAEAARQAIRAETARNSAAAWAVGTLPGGAGTKSAKEHAEDALGYAEALSFDIITPRFLYGKDVLFGRSSVDYGLGDAITQDGYHYAKYAVRVTGSPSAWSRNEADGFWEINPGAFQFDGLSFTSGDSIESDFQWYYNGQKVKRALTSPNADGSRAASLIEVEDGTVYIPKLAGGGSSVIADGIIEPIHELVPVGDSLTAAGYADSVGTSLGLPLATPSAVSNTDIGYSAGGGIGSQVAAQIAARFGAYGLTCTVTGNTLTSGANILTAINVALLSRASDAAGSNRFLRATIRTLAGRAVKGVLRCIQQAGGEITYSGQAYRYTFTPDSGETLGDVPATAYLHVEDEGRRSRVPLIWIGNNDIGSVGFDAEVKNRIAQMVAAYRPLTKKFVILSVINSTSYPSGSAGSNAVKSLNADLAAMYPDNFCDVRSAYNAGTADDTPNAAYTLDGLHYNSTGGALLSGIVTAFIQSKGWF